MILADCNMEAYTNTTLIQGFFCAFLHDFYNRKDVLAISSKFNKITVIISVLIVGFGVVFAYNAYNHYLWLRDGQLAQQNYEIMYTIFEETISELSNPVSQNNLQNPVEITPLQQARKLTNNQDIIAYISIPGTNINHVVVQSDNNDFYLYHDMFGTRNVAGAIFMDYRNSSNFFDKSTILYGHNMQNGTMFHNLRYFLHTPGFAQNNRYITIITDDDVLVYQVFAVFSTGIYFNYIQVFFETEEEFEKLLQKMADRSVYNAGFKPTYADNILVLSTCTNVDRNTRIVVVGKKIQLSENYE